MPFIHSKKIYNVQETFLDYKTGFFLLFLYKLSKTEAVPYNEVYMLIESSLICLIHS